MFRYVKSKRNHGLRRDALHAKSQDPRVAVPPHRLRRRLPAKSHSTLPLRNCPIGSQPAACSWTPAAGRNPFARTYL